MLNIAYIALSHFRISLEIILPILNRIHPSPFVFICISGWGIEWSLTFWHTLLFRTAVENRVRIVVPRPHNMEEVYPTELRHSRWMYKTCYVFTYYCIYWTLILPMRFDYIMYKHRFIWMFLLYASFQITFRIYKNRLVFVLIYSRYRHDSIRSLHATKRPPIGWLCGRAILLPLVWCDSRTTT